MDDDDIGWNPTSHSSTPLLSLLLPGTVSCRVVLLLLPLPPLLLLPATNTTLPKTLPETKLERDFLIPMKKSINVLVPVVKKMKKWISIIVLSKLQKCDKEEAESREREREKGDRRKGG